MTYKVFHGVGAVIIADPTWDTKLSVVALASDEVVDAKPSLEVDLTLTPKNIPNIDPDTVKFDNCMTVGTEQCKSQDKRGSVYIEYNHYYSYYDTHIKHGTSPWPPLNRLLGEFTSIVYLPDSGTLAGKRYHGFQATIISGPSSPSTFVVTFSLDNKTRTVDFGGTNILGTPPWEAHLGTPCLNVNSSPGATGLLFVESTYAENTLQLGDPKLPIGLEAGGTDDDSPSSPGPDPSKPSKPPWHSSPGHKPMQRISVSLAHADDVLKAVLDKIDGEARVVGAYSDDKEPPTVCSVVDRRRKPGYPVGIDLIAHASQSILQFGSWKIIDADRTCIQLRDEWKKRTPIEIRLLGCSTAGLPAGRAAMKYLKNVFGQVQSDIRVYGSMTALLAMDFGPEGFLRDDLLLEVDELSSSALTPSPAEVVTHWFKRFAPVSGSSDSTRASLTKETRSEAVARSIGPLIDHDDSADRAVGSSGLESLFKQLDTSLFAAPGLLEVPDAERLYPAESDNDTARFHRVSMFRGGAFVRVYTDEFPDGVLIRRRDVVLGGR